MPKHAGLRVGERLSAWLVLVLAVALVGAFPATPGTPVASAAAGGLFISEYVEGSSYNKAIELYNGTGSVIDLAAGNYSVEFYFNGNTSADRTINLNGTLNNGAVFVLTHSSAETAIQNVTSQAADTPWYNGDDAIVLKQGTTILDVIGQVGTDPGSQWGSGLASTKDNTLRRKATICGGDSDPNDAFDPAVEWDGFDQDSFDGLGTHTASCGDVPPTIAGTSPTNGATGVAADANVSITFSENVTVTGDWFAIECTTSGALAAAVSGGPQSYTLDPATDFAAGESCTVTVLAAQVTDQDDTPDAMVSDYAFSFGVAAPNICGAPATPIASIQGSGTATPLAGETHTIEGVVVGDFQDTNLDGFFLQEEDSDADGNPLTSEGMFVYTADATMSVPAVNEGELIRVSGTVGEQFGQTQLARVSSLTSCSGTPTASPASVSLPFGSADFPERYEGMLVNLPQALTVSENYNLARFGEVLLSNGRLYNPTHMRDPGPDAEAYAAANQLNQIILDDGQNGSYNEPVVHPAPGLTAENTLRSGATVTGLTGVLSYGFGAYRMHPTVTPVFGSDANARTVTPDAVGGSLRIASFNVLNYFNGDGQGGEFPTARGAENPFEFNRQRDKVIAAINRMDADIIGLMEIENDGYGPNSAIQDLVNGLNDLAGAGTYAFIDPGVSQIGTDQIAVGFLYRPGTVTAVGAPKILDSSIDPTYNDSRNRPALAQTFAEIATGERLTIVVNHFKSKGSGCGSGDDDPLQGNCNGTRTAAANALVAWLAGDPTGSGDPDILIIGDLNAYAREDPISAITNAGYTNLIERFLGDTAYSYVFRGEAGYLDHALASASLNPGVAGVTEWHINADEPRAIDYNEDFRDGGSQVPKSAAQLTSLYRADAYRSSDHDPVLVGLNLAGPQPTPAPQVYLPFVAR